MNRSALGALSTQVPIKVARFNFYDAPLPFAHFGDSGSFRDFLHFGKISFSPKNAEFGEFSFGKFSFGGFSLRRNLVAPKIAFMT